jgi:hypothetical protein
MWALLNCDVSGFGVLEFWLLDFGVLNLRMCLGFWGFAFGSFGAWSFGVSFHVF